MGVPRKIIQLDWDVPFLINHPMLATGDPPMTMESPIWQQLPPTIPEKIVAAIVTTSASAAA